MGLMCGSARWERARAYVPFPASMRLMYVSARWGRTLTYVPPIPVSTSMVYVWQHPAGPNTIDVPVPPPVGGGAWWRPAAAKIYWRPPPSVHWGLCMAVPDGGEHLLTSFFSPMGVCSWSLLRVSGRWVANAQCNSELDMGSE